MQRESRRYGLACVGGGVSRSNHLPPLSNRGHKLSGNSQLHTEKSLKTEDFSNIQGSVTKSVTVTFLFRLEGLKLNDTDWINDFKEKRTQYGVSQNRLAVMASVSREYVSRIEYGKVALTEEIKGKFTVDCLIN